MQTSTQEPWRARLDLELAVRAQTTRVTQVRHSGPLRIQRPFYPEEDGTGHIVILHPPGGVVGGDELHLSTLLHEGAHALLTTPAATKLYRSGGPTSHVFQEHRVTEGAFLEWLPQETIAFPGAEAALCTRVELAPGARFVGWELTCLGRPALEETFSRGRVLQRLELWRADQPLLLDRLVLGQSAATLHAPWGLASQPVVGTMILAGGPSGLSRVIRECIEELQATPPRAEPGGQLGASDLAGATVVRYVGPSVPECWAVFVAIWQVTRPLFSGTPAVLPRIWSV